MSGVEYQPYSPIPEVVVTERVQPEQPKILNSRILSFSDHTDFFRELFQSRLNTTFLVYNPSAIFTNPPDSYRAVRVDCSDGRTKSVIFKYTNEGLKPHPERTFDLEDPYADNFDGEIVFGGVQVDKSRDTQGRIVSNWRTILFRGKTISELRPFFTGPEGMKDIRLVQRPDGKIGAYTRPRSPGNESLGGDGQIGYREFESLDQLENTDPSSLDIENAPLLSFRFPKGEWGGVNHVQVVKDGEYQGCHLLLIHRAYKANNARHYSAGILLHDPKTGRIVDLGTQVTRSDFSPGPWKEEEESVEDVYIGTELILLNRYRAKIIGGMSDAETGEAEILNPLLQLTA